MSAALPATAIPARPTLTAGRALPRRRPAPRVPRFRLAGLTPRARRRLRIAGLLLSLLLHLALGWWLLFGFERRAVPEPATSESGVEVVYEGGDPGALPAPSPDGPPAPLEPPSPDALPALPAPAPRPAEPPGGAPPVAEALPPQPPAPPLPAPPLPAPPVISPPALPPLARLPQPVPPPPAPPRDVPPEPPLARAPPVPPPPAGPAVPELSLPPPPAPSEAAREPEVAALPLPPPPAPAPPAAPPEATARAVPLQPAPRARPAPVPAPNPFAGALDLSRGGPVALGGRPAPPPGGSGRSERAAPRDGGASTAQNADVRVRGENPGQDWIAALRAWVRARGYYPRQAVEAGEDGPATVRFTVDRSGRITGLQLIGRSGSIWLDSGIQAIFRGGNAPPLPASMQGSSTEIEFTIHYILRRS